MPGHPAGMTQIRIRFYQELNDFLAPDRRQREFDHEVRGRASVKDVVESLGVPHTEIDLILVNGLSVGFEAILRDGDRVSVYPQFESLDIGTVERLRPEPLREPRFILNTHLGRLAAYLRLFGFDCLWRSDWEDETLARISSEEERILLTRDRGLLKRKVVTRGYCPRADHPRRQVVEVLRRFDLLAASRPLTRCLACNGLLSAASRSEVAGHIPPDVATSAEVFARCRGCGRVYWKGSHYDRLVALLDGVRAELQSR